jgi:adenosylmethionine-8-amino-7-oxononanoate aminotransferase
VVREVRGKGLLLGVELVEDLDMMRPFPPGRKLGEAMKETAKRNKIIMRIDPDWFAVAPALIAEPSEIDEMCELIKKSVCEALEMVRSQEPL